MQAFSFMVGLIAGVLGLAAISVTYMREHTRTRASRTSPRAWLGVETVRLNIANEVEVVQRGTIREVVALHLVKLLERDEIKRRTIEPGDHRIEVTLDVTITRRD